MAKTPTPYPDLNRVLAELVEGVQAILGERFVGAYSQGSFAVGDFDEHSDVDVIMLHDLHTGHPGSKRAGAEWAKATLDPSWVGLIDRPWAGRPNPAWSVRQSADPTDFQATLAFVRYMLDESRAYAGDGESE